MADAAEFCLKLRQYVLKIHVTPSWRCERKSCSSRGCCSSILSHLAAFPISEAEQVEALLKQRYTNSRLSPALKDIKRFIALVEQQPDKAELFASYLILKRRDEQWRAPLQVYLDTPFVETGLALYYGAPREDAACDAISDSYLQCGIAHERLVNFATAVGARSKLKIIQVCCVDNPDWQYLQSVGGSRWSSYVDRDYTNNIFRQILGSTVACEIKTRLANHGVFGGSSRLPTGDISDKQIMGRTSKRISISASLAERCVGSSRSGPVRAAQ